MPEEMNRFHYAINGFNRNDVTHYLSELSFRHKTEKEELTGEIIRLKEENSTLNETVSELQSHIAELEEKCSDTSAQELADLAQEEAEEAVKKLETCLQEKEVLEKKLSEANAALSEARIAGDDLLAQLTVAEGERSALAQKADDLSAMEDELQQSDARNAELSRQLQESDDKLKEAQSASDGLQSEINSLRADNNRISAEAAQLSSEISELKLQNSSFENQYVSLLKEYEQLRIQYDSLKEQAASIPPAPDYTSEELTAYRRAEAAERNAQDRANRLSRNVTSLLADSVERFGSAECDVRAICKEASDQIRRLYDTLTEISGIYEDTSASLEKLNVEICPQQDAQDEM